MLPAGSFEKLDVAAASRRVADACEVKLLVMADDAILHGTQPSHLRATGRGEVHDLAGLCAAEILRRDAIALEAQVVADKRNVPGADVRHPREHATAAEHLDLEPLARGSELE